MSLYSLSEKARLWNWGRSKLPSPGISSRVPVSLLARALWAHGPSIPALSTPSSTDFSRCHHHLLSITTEHNDQAAGDSSKPLVSPVPCHEQSQCFHWIHRTKLPAHVGQRRQLAMATVGYQCHRQGSEATSSRAPPVPNYTAGSGSRCYGAFPFPDGEMMITAACVNQPVPEAESPV